MNIFILDKALAVSAQYHVDSHVRKQILEAAQVACTVHHLLGGEAPYRPTHKNHPIVRWAADSLTAYKYTVRYGLALVDEFEYRFGKSHKTKDVLLWLQHNIPAVDDRPTSTIAVVPDDCQLPSVVESYRRYYSTHKQHLAKWTKREVPPWM